MFYKHHGRWPQSIAELTTDAAVGDMGPVVPIGGAPFGFRNIDGNVELWGVAIEQCDVTPWEPFDPSQTPDEWDDHLSYWYWDMKPPCLVNEVHGYRCSRIDFHFDFDLIGIRWYVDDLERMKVRRHQIIFGRATQSWFRIAEFLDIVFAECNRIGSDRYFCRQNASTWNY